MRRGWFVARHIVERHGGSLAVEFPPEGGVRTILTLPTRGGRGPVAAAPSPA